MDPNLPIGISVGIGALLYTVYLVKSAMRDVREHEGYPIQPILLPEQAISLQEPKPSITARFSEAWREVKAEKEVKLLPPLEKVQHVSPEEEEEWFLQPEEEEPEEEETSEVPSLAPTQSIAGDIPIDLLESHSKREYYDLLCDITDKVALHYKSNGKITRDGMVPREIPRNHWDYTMSQPNGVFRKAGMIETQNGVTVILEDCDEWLHLFLREKGYKFTDGIYSEEE